MISTNLTHLGRVSWTDLANIPAWADLSRYTLGLRLRPLKINLQMAAAPRGDMRARSETHCRSCVVILNIMPILNVSKSFVVDSTLVSELVRHVSRRAWLVTRLQTIALIDWREELAR